jgi:transcriptional regulator with GAF, ATPase, and Fis domain
MNFRHPRAAVFGIWGLVVLFGIVEAVAWTLGGGVPRRPLVLVQVIGAWIVMLVLAVVATRRIGGLARTLSHEEHERSAALNQVEQLEMWNAILEIIARSVDVPLAFQALAQRIVRLVPCDRVGLALVSEDGQEFQTYTARADVDERRVRPRPEVVFKIERTALGTAVRSREPLNISDTTEGAPDFLDVNLLRSSGLMSALILPLVAKGRAVGTLNVASRQRNAFTQQHIDVLTPVAEIFAIAYVAQQLQIAMGKHRSMETMSEVTLSIASEINSALQTIVGYCDLLERGYPDPNLQRDLATVVHQAQRIAGLLDKMRVAAHERMKEVTAEIKQGGIPSSPEAYRDTEIT